MQLDKAAIRRTILAERKHLTIHQQHSQCITQLLCQHPSYRQAKHILAYLNFGHEYASEQLVKQLLQDGKNLILPRVNSMSKQLDLYRVHDLENQLILSKLGIREPIIECCSPLNTLNEVELVLLPGVAFTRRGERLGYGGGFYDKLLARMPHRPVLIAAAFALQIVDFLPQEPTDIKVDWIVTEQEIIHCLV